MNWTGSTGNVETMKYKSVPNESQSWTNPNINNFMGHYSLSNYSSWVYDNLNRIGPYNLWQTGGSTNPCPSGYHVPTATELLVLQNSITKSNTVLDNDTNSNAIWSDVVLRFPAAGLRIDSSLIPHHMRTNGYVWSSEQYDSNYSQTLWLSSGSSGVGRNNERRLGFSVRCLKD